MNIFRLPEGHWIGPPLNTLPSAFFTTLKDKFELIEHDNDISILTLPNITYIFFYLSAQNESLLDITSKICINLSKGLILIHNNFTSDITIDKSVLLKEINLTKSGTVEEINALALQVSMQQSSMNPIDDLNPNQHLDSHSGSRIDIFRTLKHIEDNLEKEIREEDVAALCHYSVTYFSKLFHDVIGISFRDYLTNKRINRAKHLLTRKKTEKISSIAYQCGYNDVSYFSRIFKKKTGLTPGNYRKINEYSYSHI